MDKRLAKKEHRKTNKMHTNKHRLTSLSTIQYQFGGPKHDRIVKIERTERKKKREYQSAYNTKLVIRSMRVE